MSPAGLRGMSRGRQRLLLAAFVAVVTALLAAAAEAFVRVRQYVAYGRLWGVEETYRVDPESGLRTPIPGADFGTIRINSLGFRGPEIEVPKPSSTLRLAFLGASTTYCAEASTNDATWPHLVWQDLSRRWPDVRFDYVNGGVPGYGVADSLKNLQHRVRPLEPDVIVVYHATNDLSANSFELAVRQGLVERRTEQELSWPAHYSLLWYLVEKNLMIRWRQAGAREAMGKLSFDPRELAQPFRADLTELLEASRESASLAAVITFSTRLRRDQDPADQVAAAVTSLYYMPYMSIDGLLEGFEAYNQTIREVAAETGALLIEAERAIPGDAVHFNDSVHFTDRGNTAMARRVADALADSSAFVRLVESRRQGGR
jgi:lysophospholipase L1-like esterase